MADELLGTLGEHFTVGQERLHLSGSVGIALAPEHGRNVSDLLKRADIAMYAAKNGADSRVLYRAGHRRERPVAAVADGRAARGDRHRRRSTSRSSRWSTCRTAGSSRPRHWCAGTTRCAARCAPGCSCRWPSATA